MNRRAFKQFRFSNEQHEDVPCKVSNVSCKVSTCLGAVAAKCIDQRIVILDWLDSPVSGLPRGT